MKKLVDNHEDQVQRVLEILPGATAWMVILFPLWGALLVPKLVAYFTVGFLVFWFYRSFLTAFLGSRAFFRIRQAEKTNWYRRYLKDRQKGSLPWQSIRHIILIPNVNESIEKLSASLDCLARQKNINLKQLMVVLAMEDRVEGAHQKAQKLLRKYRHRFGQMIATFHPGDLPGEVVGKASNEAWAAKEAKKILVDQQGHNINHVTLTSCDADACFHRQYFSALTYYFALNPQRYQRFWQSPIFGHNNFWKVPAFTRIINTLGNILHAANLQEPDNLYFNYSSYSASLKMINKAGYWHTNIIPEDWHIFLQCFFDNSGQVEVEPIFLPTSIDAPEGKNYFHSLKNRYEQCKRHAWGATDIPYAIKESLRHPEIPLWTRFFRISKLFETHIIWSTNWFILTLGAWLPALINPYFKQTTLGYNLPRISQGILTACLFSLLVVIILDAALRPKKFKELSRWYIVREYAQWLFMPVATLLMAVLPGLDSQTRLMLGQRMEYQTTEKF